MKNITSVAVSLFFLLSFCSFSLGNVQRAENLGILASANSGAHFRNAEKPKQVVKKKILTKEEREALIEEGKRKKLEKAQEESQEVQLSSTQKPTEFKTRFPSLAALDSKVLKELATSLTFPKDFSSELWFKCNPVYGALLWRSKVIHNLVFILKKSPYSGGLNNLIRNFFEDIGPYEVIIKKECPKNNWGCVAGHLFLYEQGKIKNSAELSKIIEKNCQRKYDSDKLEALFNLEYQERIKIKHFLPSLIGAFVFAASKEFSTPETAAEYLQRYRYEFQNAIKNSYNKDELSYNESLVDQDLNGSREEMKFFKESFNFLCESFIGYQVPTGLEFVKDFTYKYAKNKKVTWSNCNEIAFINWVLGIAYNPENHKFEPEKVTTNEILKDSFSKTNGFDTLFDQSAASGILQNLPFVIYRQIKIGEDKLAYHEDYNEGIVLVPHEFYEKLKFKEKFLHNPTDNPHNSKIKEQNSKYLCKDGSFDNLSLEGKYNGSIYFIDQSAYPDAFCFDLDSTPVNFLLLCHYLGFPSLSEKFQSTQEIFEMVMKPGDEFYKVLNDFVSKYGGKVTRKSNDVVLKFPFGFFDIPSRHAIFGFTGKSITLKSSDLLEQDNFLKIILSEKDIFEDQFEKLCWALVKKKVPKNQIANDSTKMSFNVFFDKISFPDTENFIADLIIKDPTVLNEIQKGSLGDGIFRKIEGYFDKRDTIIFSRLTKEITNRNVLLKVMKTIFDHYNDVSAEEFYHSSTRNQGLLKAYGGLFFASGENPIKAKEFVLEDLATNYQSFEREALVNLILEICSFTAMNNSKPNLFYKKMITAAINYDDEQDTEDFEKISTEALNNDETIQILNKLPFLTKEYLKGYSYSFAPSIGQPSDYKRIVSPSFYAAFALRYDLSLEFIREIEDEFFDYNYDKYFKGLEIEQEKFDQLKEDFGDYEFFKEIENLIKVK